MEAQHVILVITFQYQNVLVKKYESIRVNNLLFRKHGRVKNQATQLSEMMTKIEVWKLLHMHEVLHMMNEVSLANWSSL